MRLLRTVALALALMGAAPAAAQPQPAVADALDAAVVVEGWVKPAANRLADAAGRLQNAVVRACSLPSRAADAQVVDAFAGMIAAVAALEPRSFGSDKLADVPNRLLAPALDTTFGSTGVLETMIGRTDRPTSVAELAATERGLQGLPALELLLFHEPTKRAASRNRRCGLAVLVAASVRRSAERVVWCWQNDDLDPHWQTAGDRPEARARLFDMVGAFLRTADKVGRCVLDDLACRGARPFLSDQLMFAYVERGLTALTGDLEALGRFGGPNTAVLVLEPIVSDLRAAHDGLIGLGDPAKVKPAMRAALTRIDADLAAAFGFDRAAFAPLSALSQPGD